MTRRVLLSGASGFVGSHVLRHILAHTEYDVVCPVTFRHHGLPGRVAEAISDHKDWAQRVHVIHWDLRAPADTVTLSQIGDIDYVFNVASESHVDRSILYPGKFIQDNVAIMTNVLAFARAVQPRMFFHMSTDEVYGPAYDGQLHKEWDVIAPSNPYSASKAAQEAIAFAYWRTYGVPVVITNTMNIIGEMQDKEKFVPLIMRKLLADEPITVHVGADGLPGSRFYLHARNLADAWLWLLGEEGHSWDLAQFADGSSRPCRLNIVGEREVDNVEMVNWVGSIMGLKPKIEKVEFHASRPGHDLRYALDGTELGSSGWTPPVPLWPSLKKTVLWTMEHQEWLA